MPDGENIGLIAQTARHCLGTGHNVIVEGILVAKHYRSMLYELIREHHGAAHVFYLDVPLEETQRRHAARSLAAEIPMHKLR